MFRRRGPNEEYDSHLIEDVEISSGDKSSVDSTSPRIKEESHIISQPFSVLKRRITTKASSPKGKLLYWWIVVVLLGIISFVFVLVPLLIERGKERGCSDFVRSQYEGSEEEIELPFFFKRDTGRFEICQDGKSVLIGTLGVNRTVLSEVKVNVFTDSTNSILNITNLPSKKNRCLLIEWVGTSSKEMPLCDCYEYGSGVHWYGAYEQYLQQWPLDSSTSDPFEFSPFLPNDYFTNNVSFGSVLHPLWLSTAGVGIIVQEGVQLRVSMNATTLCLSAKPFQLECISNASVRSFLNYTVCAFDTVAQAARYFLGESGFIPHSKEIPEPSLFNEPLWTSSVEVNNNFSMDEVVKFCEGIISHGFNVSQFEIGDGYSHSCRDFLFDSKFDFDTIATSTCNLFSLSVWVHPFVNFDSSRFQHGLDSNFFLPGYTEVNGHSVSLVQWCNRYRAVANFIDSNATMNYLHELLNFKMNYNLSSFNFDGGEYNYLPKCVFIDHLKHPGDFTKAYVDFISNLTYPNRASVHVGFFTQDKPIFVRLRRTLTQDFNETLKSILNAVFSVGLAGYSFVIPEMIEESGYHASCSSPNNITCMKLYLRWAQLNTFLPVMHFAFAPWHYSNVNFTKHMKLLSQIHASLNFIDFATESLRTGYPIIRPLWWRATEIQEPETWTITDQFFIGDNYMVAPILEIGPESEIGPETRMVYFPHGAKYILAPSTSGAPKDSPCPSRTCNGGTHVSFTIESNEVLWFTIEEL